MADRLGLHLELARAEPCPCCWSPHMPHAAGSADAWAPIRSYTTRCHIDAEDVEMGMARTTGGRQGRTLLFVATPSTAMSVPEAARRPRYGSYCRTVVLSYCVLSCLLRSSSHEYTRSFILRASARILNVSSSSTNRRQSSKQELAIGPKAEREARLGRTPTAGQQGLRVVCPRAWEVEHVAGPEHRLERCGDSIERRRT